MQKFVPISSKKILEIGCGQGNFGLALKKSLGAEVWGIDISEKYAKLAEENLDKVIIGDINNLMGDLPDKSFDAIIMNDVLEHLYNPWEVINKLKIKLNPEHGVLVCSIPNIRYFRVLFKLFFAGKWDYEQSGILDFTHMRFFTKDGIIKMFASEGYVIRNIEGLFKTKSMRPKILNFLFWGKFADTYYTNFAVVAQPLK